jgi:peptidyl-prolyl cis-trans isomerase A (cyclophilin A)
MHMNIKHIAITLLAGALVIGAGGCELESRKQAREAEKAAEAEAARKAEEASRARQAQNEAGDTTARRPADMPPGAARPAPPTAGGGEVRPPRAEDLAEYVKDLSGSGALRATIKTSMGDFNCELYEKQTPMTVANFVGLARGLKPWRHPRTGAVEKKPYFDGIVFHRVIPDFMVQTGDPLGMGVGGPGYDFDNEIVPALKHDSGGILSMANRGPGTNGSQFFITEKATPWLDGKHTVFGKCKEVELVKRMTRVDKDPADRSGSKPKEPITINTIEISRGGSPRRSAVTAEARRAPPPPPPR